MGEWAATVFRLIQTLTTIAGLLFSIGMAWNLTQIVISVGVDGLPRVIPQVVFNTLGLLFGFLIVANAFKITMGFFSAFIAPVFGQP
jgi:hypothetical protein